MVRAVDKAAKVAKTVRKGGRQKVIRKRTKVHFYRPKTATSARAPAYTRKAVARLPGMDKYRVIKGPHNSETAMKKTEEHNTLVLIVDLRANKVQIKRAVKELYDVTVVKVNTLIRPDGTKKAFVKLSPDNDALDIAHKIGVV